MANRTVAVNFVANTAGYVTGVGKAAAATGSLQASASMLTRSLIGPGALIFALSQAVKFANQTEQAQRGFATELTKLRTQIGLTTEETHQMGRAALALGGDTTKGPQELAEAMFFIASAGLRGSAAMDVLRSSARLSAIGLGETKVIADLLTSAVNAYGEETLSAAQASDTLVAAVRLGKLEADSLAGAMGRVLPIASAMGVSFEEVGGLMAAMSKTGTDAATATTQLRAIMVSLLKPSQQANEAMTELGLTQRQVRDTITQDGLFSALLMLNDAVDGNTEKFAQLFPNVRALAGVMDLLGPQLQGNIDLMQEMGLSAGLASDAFAIFAGTSQAQVERLQAAQERLAILQGEYQVGARAFIRERRIFLAESRGDRIEFERNTDSFVGLMLDQMVPAIDAFRAANFESTAEMRAARAGSEGMNFAMSSLEDTVLRLDRSTGIASDSLDIYTLNALGARNMTLEQAEAVFALVESLLAERDAIGGLNEYYDEWDPRRRAATDATGDAEREENALARALGFTNAELRDQINLLRDQLDERLALIDPVYAAIRAEQDYAQATADVNALVREGKTGSEEYVTALFEQEIAFLRMQGALAESGVVMDNFVEHLNDMAADGRITESAIQAIIDRLNEQGAAMELIDGKVTRSTHVHEVVTVNTFNPLTYDWAAEKRARGGPIVAGRPYIVGEEGPELIIPSEGGQVFTAPETRRMMGRPAVAGSLVPPSVSEMAPQTSGGIVIQEYNTFRSADDQALLAMLEMAQQAGRL
jgi:TP901 family phage tail tape measure protein